MTNDYERYNYWENEINKPLTNQEKKDIYNREIDDAVNRINNGEYIPNDKVWEDLK